MCAPWWEREASGRQRCVAAVTSAPLSHQANTDRSCGRGRKDSARSPAGLAAGISNLSAKPKKIEGVMRGSPGVHARGSIVRSEKEIKPLNG